MKNLSDDPKSQPINDQSSLRNDQRFLQVCFDFSNDAVMVHEIGSDGTFGRFVEVNKASCERLGYTREELLQLTPSDIDSPETANQDEVIGEIIRNKDAVFDRVHTTKDHRKINVEISSRVFEVEGTRYIVSIARDITDRKLASERLEKLVSDRNAQLYETCDSLVEEVTRRRHVEEALRITHHFLEIANRNLGMDSLLGDFVKGIQELTRCHAVAIRLLDAEGNIPYKAYFGFSNKFYELESPLSIKSDKCMCINVVKGTTDPSLPCYTDVGSFCISQTTKFLSEVGEAEKGMTRNACNLYGYESVALIPIRSSSGIIGLIHVADEREDMVPKELVTLLENIAGHIGAAIERVWLTEALRVSEHQFKMIFENANDAIILWEFSDPDGRYKIAEANEIAYDRYGYSHDEIVQLSMADLNTVEGYPHANYMAKTLEQIGHATYELVHKTKSGGLIPSEVSGHIFTQGGRKYILSVIRDIRTRKQNELKLAQAFDREAELHTQLKKEMARRTEFTRALIHELKTPLTPILASSDMLLKTTITGTARRLARQIHTGAAELDARINELFDLIRGELGILDLRCQMIKPGSLTKEVVDHFQSAAAAKGINLQSRVSGNVPDIMADKSRLRQVLVNLIDNAIKYTPDNGQVITTVAVEDKEVLIDIKDTGIGISEDEQCQLFEPYSRISNSSDNLRGLGLGLAISKVLIELHGGSLTVESKVGRGSTFRVTMPLDSGKCLKNQVET